MPTMFKLQTEEHGLIRDAIAKVFTDLEATDKPLRQGGRGRIAGVDIGVALAELGLLGPAADASMTTATVQTIAAIEAGAVALPFPVIEALAGQYMSIDGQRSSGDANAWITLPIGGSARAPELSFEGGVLQGRVRLVPFAHLANEMLVAARHGGKPVLVRASLRGDGLATEARESVEPEYPLHDLQLTGSPAHLVDSPAGVDGGPVEVLRSRAALLAAAEIAGACRRMVAMTREHLLVRTQFGQPLGVNQALKHRLADDHVRVEALVAAVEYAAAASDAGSPDADVSILAAKHFASRVARAVANDALQLHGAIGYTEEFPLQLFMRRAHRLTCAHGARTEIGDRIFDLFKAAA
jgi:alkylation response protein AidB-like acyl-CoA dehydrogenase